MEEDHSSPWDTFQSIVSTDLGIPAEQINGSCTYSDLGGTSINILSAILRLQQAGYAVSIEQLMKQDLRTLIQSNPTTEIVPQKKYSFSIRPLKEADDILEQCFILVAESFITKCEMFSMCGNMTVDDFVYVIRACWTPFSKHSFAVVDEKNVPRAACFNADAADMLKVPFDKFHSHLKIVGEMMEEICGPVEKKYNPDLKEGVVFSKVLIGCALQNTPEENIILVNMAELENKRIAEHYRFHITMAENTSSVTQQISAHLGCIRYAEIVLNQWTSSKGERPFSNCPDDFKLTVDVFETDNHVDRK